MICHFSKFFEEEHDLSQRISEQYEEYATLKRERGNIESALTDIRSVLELPQRQSSSRSLALQSVPPALISATEQQKQQQLPQSQPLLTRPHESPTSNLNHRRVRRSNSDPISPPRLQSLSLSNSSHNRGVATTLHRITGSLSSESLLSLLFLISILVIYKFTWLQLSSSICYTAAPFFRASSVNSFSWVCPYSTFRVPEGVLTNRMCSFV